MKFSTVFRDYMTKYYSDVETKGSDVDKINAEDHLTYLQSMNKHKKLMDIYYPVGDAMTQKERVSKSAARVGLK
eukprot:Pgem_evm1s17395